jgi:endonuclease-3 related protein
MSDLRPSPNLTVIYQKLYRGYGPQHWWPADSAWEVVVGTILTQNTAWKNVEAAISSLRAGHLLSLRKMAAVRRSVLARRIRPAGYFNVKAARLKNFVSFLYRRHQGSLEKLWDRPVLALRQELLSVNGVGPETADSIILYAARKPIFVIDAYTRRIFSRLGWISKNESYEDIQRIFMKRLPRRTRLFNEYHALVVAHAKNTCLARRPRCSACVLNALCRYFSEAKTS